MNINTNKFMLASYLGLSSMLLSGCGSDSSSSTPIVAPITSSYLQAVHASKDAPLANVTINGSQTLNNVDYGQASGYLMLNSGDNTVQVDVQLPSGEVATVIPSTSLSLSDMEKYTVMVIGEADSASSYPVEPLIITRPKMGTASDSSLDVQVVHASGGVPDVDLYVTAPNADINTEAPLATLGFKDSTGVVNIANGDYQIRLTLSGTKTVAFDSGTIPLAANAELTIAAIPNTNEVDGSSPVKLLVMDGTTSSTLYNTSEKAQLRVGHLVYDAPQVDAALNGTEAISNLDFKAISTPYAAIDGGSYDVTVYAGDDPANLTVINAEDVAFMKGMDYSVYAVNLLASIEPLVIMDERRKVATSAVLNILHAAQNPAAAAVDIYLTASMDITSSSPALEDFTYKQSAQQVYVAAGTYYVTVTAPDSKTAVIGPAEITLENAKVYQAIAISDSASTFDLLVNEITE